MVFMQALQATEVRKNWGEFIDAVVHDKPKLVKRNRDLFIAMGLPHLQALTDDLKIQVFFEADEGGTTAYFEEIDLVVYAETREAATVKLAEDLVEYAEEYFEVFERYYNSTNRKSHFRYVFKVILQDSIEDVIKMFEIV